MNEWDHDPLFAQIRNEFINSFSRRLERIQFFSEKNSSPLFTPSDLAEIQLIVHNLAGVGKSYGFLILGQIANSIDDWMTLEQPLRRHEELRSSILFLGHALALAIRDRTDPLEILEVLCCDMTSTI